MKQVFRDVRGSTDCRENWFGCIIFLLSGGGKGGFVLRKRLYCGVEETVLRGEKGSFRLRKRLFGAVVGRMMRGGAVYMVGRQRVTLNVEKSRICGGSYYVSVLKHSRGVVVG